MAKRNWRFSIMFAQGQHYGKSVELWQACENAGMSLVGVADSPNLLREVYVSTTLCILNTKKVPVITYVTNPVTRHPSVTACGFMSLNELSPGRIGMGIGSGDSALWSIGKKGAKVQLMHDYIVAVKRLLRGEKVKWDDYEFKAEWSFFQPFELPVYVACSGPRILRVAAETSEAAIVTMGFSDDDINDVKSIVDEGRRAAGRTAGKFDIWWQAHVTFDDSYEAAAARSIGWSPSWLTMGSLEGKGIPDQYKAKLLELNADTHNLQAVYRTKNREQIIVERAKALGIYDWLMSRSPRLLGTPKDVAKRLNELADRHGTTDWLFFASGRGERAAATNQERLDLINKLAYEVAPLLT
ncbi:MAG: LLM class flavin-dependent oxidoreductase [Alphaproteobacteria bacterium]|nr:LLM class flavin-dependent oxidoreductase [Alphaproteobacteria bacterium]